jgi:hypothetical protein
MTLAWMRQSDRLSCGISAEERIMTSPLIPEPMPALPRPGQMVSWRDLRHAQALCWTDILGCGPFEVVRTVDKSAEGLARSLILRTQIGEREISEVWLELLGERETPSDFTTPAQEQSLTKNRKPRP